METHKTTAKDFFFHLGLIISLYAGVGFLLNLLFSVINSAFPSIDSYYYNNPSISFPVAALIILTPVFLILASYIGKIEMIDPSKKEIWVKRWSTYLTMFITGAVVVGDLITVLYYFLDGRDLTTAFLLKVFAVLVVLGAVFGYFFASLSNTLTSNGRKVWRIGAIVLVLISIILGFTVIGSPQTQRLMRYDNQRVMDLQNIQSQIITYWQSKASIPATLSDLDDSLSYYTEPKDPQTSMSYEYRVIDATSFELCATFSANQPAGKARANSYVFEGGMNGNWQYSKGHQCFKRTIDSELYPVNIKGMPVPVR